MKVFISLPMNGYTEAVVREEQQKFLKELRTDMQEKGELKVDESLELIDTVTHASIPANPSRLWYLGEAIKKLDEADLVYFAGDWYKAKGCWVEYVAACAYGKNVVYDYPDLQAADIFRAISSWIENFTTKKGEDSND